MTADSYESVCVVSAECWMREVSGSSTGELWLCHLQYAGERDMRREGERERWGVRERENMRRERCEVGGRETRGQRDVRRERQEEKAMWGEKEMWGEMWGGRERDKRRKTWEGETRGESDVRREKDMRRKTWGGLGANPPCKPARLLLRSGRGLCGHMTQLCTLRFLLQIQPSQSKRQFSIEINNFQTTSFLPVKFKVW